MATKQDGLEPSSVRQILFWAFYPYRKTVFFALSLGVLARGAFLMQANVIGWWADRLCIGQDVCKGGPQFTANWSQTDFVLCLGFLTSFGLVGTVLFRLAYGRTASLAVSQLYDEVTMRVSRFPMRFFDMTETGRIMTRFSSDYGNVFRVIGGPMAEFISLGLEISLIFILMVSMSPWMLVFVIPMVSAYLTLYKINRPEMDVQRRKQAAARAPGIAHFAETLQGALSIRVYQRIENFTKRFSREDEVYLQERFAQQKLGARYGFTMGLVSTCSLFVFGLSSYFLVKSSILSVGQVGVIIGFILSLNSSVQAFFELMPQIEECMVGLDRLGSYLMAPIENGNFLPSQCEFPTGHRKYSPTMEKYIRSRKVTSKGNAGIVFKNVWFRYHTEQSWILKNVSIEILPGERIGLIGKTGSGKTSLIQALFHLYPIEKGQILFNQSTIGIESTQSGMDLNLFRKNLAYISQDPTLFTGTLRENLDLDGIHSDEKMISVLERVGLKDWFDENAKSLDFRISERGRNLSQGERQLVCMSRCLLQDAPVVVLDEATSNVDPHSEELMMKAILGSSRKERVLEKQNSNLLEEQIQVAKASSEQELFGGKTQLIIAHRLSTLETCDRILWMDRGEIKGFGAPGVILKSFLAEGGSDLTN